MTIKVIIKHDEPSSEKKIVVVGEYTEENEYGPKVVGKHVLHPGDWLETHVWKGVRLVIEED